MVDGEIVIVQPHGLDFDRLQMRLHPAASRVAKLAKETPASFVAFDLLAHDGRDLRGVAAARAPRAARSARSARVQAPIHLTPSTRDARVAEEWLARFEGAGLDGVIAKPLGGSYEPGKRVDAQDQARAHGRLRRRRLSLAQDRQGHADRLAAARPV